jgi:hypothetical protein
MEELRITPTEKPNVYRIEGAPDFKNEKEEAEWWDAHPEVTLKGFELAAAAGTLGKTNPMLEAIEAARIEEAGSTPK